MNIFEFIFKPIVDTILNFINDIILSTGIETMFFMENAIGFPDETLNSIKLIIMTFALSLLTLKLLYKLFNIYIVNTDGDSTVSPSEYLISYIKGIIIILSFTVFYEWIVLIISDFNTRILDLIIGTSGISVDKLMEAGGSIFLFLLVYCVCFLVLYFNIFMNGVRMFFLRMAMPFACTGLVDNDNGIYMVFQKNILQTAFSFLAQIILMQVSLIPIINNTTGTGYISMVVSIAILMYSFRLPSDLNQIFMATVSTGAGQKISSIGRGVQSAISVFKK